jgi:hypothetical protein
VLCPNIQKTLTPLPKSEGDVAVPGDLVRTPSEDGADAYPPPTNPSEGDVAVPGDLARTMSSDTADANPPYQPSEARRGGPWGLGRCSL